MINNVKNILYLLIFLISFIGFSVVNIYGQNDTRAETLYFSTQIPDTWMYETGSNSYMAQFMGFGPVNFIRAIPVDIAEILATDDSDNSTSFAAQFQQEEGYSMKNAPFSMFEKYILNNWLDTNRWNVTNTDNKSIKIDTEPTIKILANGKKQTESEDKKIIVYATKHDDNAYVFEAFGDPINFDKYLPEFEQMIKTIKWID